MKKNYLIFPMKVMGITQTYDGKTSHYISSHGTPSDYPIDIAGKDTGREAFYCPCDEMEVVKIAGDVTGNNHANGAWLVSTSEVDFADGTRDICTIKFVHMNNSDFGRNGIYVGRRYKRGELIGYEGTSHASGNHVHMSAGKGGLKGSGWTKNSKGSWVITTTHGTAKPETLFFVEKMPEAWFSKVFPPTAARKSKFPQARRRRRNRPMLWLCAPLRQQKTARGIFIFPAVPKLR